MSTSITAANGLVVVTQVFSQDDNGNISVPLVPNVIPRVLCSPPVGAPLKVSEMTRMFLRGEPQSLGIVQIFVGLVCMIVSLLAVLSPSQYGQAPFFMGVAFVVSGSLAVAARKGTGLGLIRATLALNIISSLVGLAGVAYVCFLLATKTNEDFCNPNSIQQDSVQLGYGQDACRQMMWQLNAVLSGVRGLVLVLLVLEVCVSVTVCVYSGKAVARHGLYSYNPATVVVESGCVAATSTLSVCDSDVALLDEEPEKLVTIPPPYSP